MQDRMRARPRRWEAFAALALLLPFAAPLPLAAQETDVAGLVGRMTLDEKLTLLHGARDPSGEAGAGYVPGIPRLGIPPLRMADGPAGIRTREPATALPAPVMLAATFDTALARRFGEVIGREGRARGQDVLLSPMVNIVRVPQAGRNFETLGEDPLLAGWLVGAEVRGIEGEGLIATVKHYVANNFERDRMSADEAVDERAMHEIYLPGFAAAVEAGAGAVMCAYNKVNGTHACESPELLTRILRDDLGFQGWVMTDWFARHSLGALEAGLDQEMPGTSFGPGQPVYFADSLRAAVEMGRIPEAVVDRAVTRILGQMDRMGLLGEGTPRPDMDEAAGAAVAREVALAGAVLLKNEDGALPLEGGDLASLVVIGPTAHTPLYGGGGSSRVVPLRSESPLAALARRAGADIRYLPGIDLDGVPVPASALRPSTGAQAHGLSRSGPEGGTQVDAVVDFTRADTPPSGTAWTWTGTLTAPTTGVYALKLQTSGGGGSLSLDGTQLLSTGGFFSDASLLPTRDGLENATATVSLLAGESHEIEVTADAERSEGGPREPLRVRLAWVTPERQRAYRDEAIEAARETTAAVVFAYDEGTEGRDRPSLSLPDGQDELVSALAAANPHTTVVLNTGDPVLMPWVDDVGAILEMWYPGQEGADVTAALLLGEAVPSGRLPVTFPRREQDTPVAGSDARYPGIDGRVAYDEGILVGYRWYDARGTEPLFPFGHGLSYTTFEYSDPDVRPTADGFEIRVRLRNAGAVPGSEVVQVYLGPPTDPPVPMAPRRLVGFERIHLGAGDEGEVRIRIGPRELARWSTVRHTWVAPTGNRRIWIGSSSRDLRASTEIGLETAEP